MTRFTHSFIFIGTLAFGCLFAQSDPKAVRPDDGTIVLEPLLKDATAALEKERTRIRERVRTAVAVFATPQADDTGRVFRKEREAISAFGPIAIDEILAVFGRLENREVLEQLGLVLAPLHMSSPNVDVTNALLAILESSAAERARVAALVLCHAQDGTALVPMRRVATDSKFQMVRAAALLALAWLADPDGPPLWHAALKDGSPEVRRGAIQAIDRAARPQDFKLVLPFAREAELEVRLAAVSALGSMRENGDALRTLFELTKDPEERVVLGAIDAIGRFGNKESSRKPLKDLASDDKVDIDVRTRAARVLLEFGNDDGVEKLVEFVRKRRGRDDPNTRMEVGRLYFEFKLYKSAITEFDKLVTMRGATSSDLTLANLFLARSHARLGNFPKAADSLSRSGSGNDWRGYRDDDDFVEMQKDKRWSKHFEGTP